MTVRITPAPASKSLRVGPAAAVDGPTASASWSSGGTIEEVVVLTPRLRIGLWLVLFLVVVVNTALLVSTAVLYHHHDTRGKPLWAFRVYFLSYRDGAFLQKSAGVFATGYICLATLFILYVAQLVYVSMKRRGLHFGAKATTTVITRRVFSRHSEAIITAVSTSCGARIYRRISAVQYLLSVHGPYFDFRRLADDSLNLLSQTGAAYASSRQMSNAPLNLSYGVVICLTSLCPTIMGRVYHKSLVKQRMACLVADLVLDFTAAPVIELCLNVNQNPGADNAIAISRDIERVLSWHNYALSVISFIGTLLNLIEIQSILQEVQGYSQLATDPSLPLNMVVLTLRYMGEQRRHGLLFRLAQKALPLYGTLALIVTLAANRSFFGSHGSTASCIHRVYPWFMTDEVCVGRRINCSALEISGTAAEIGYALDQFTPRMLTDVLFTYCPALTVPRRVTALDRLESLDFCHSHIIQWREDTAVTSTNFPKLRTIQLTSVTFQDLPHIQCHRVARGTNWERVRCFDCVGCELVPFPSAVKAMAQLSMLQDSRIVTVMGATAVVTPTPFVEEAGPARQLTCVEDVVAAGKAATFYRSTLVQKRVNQIEYVDEVVAVSSSMRRMLWCSILVVVFANGALLGVFAYAYAQNETNDSLVWFIRTYFLFSKANAFLMQNCYLVVAGYAVLCALFGAIAVQLVWASVIKQQLRFSLRPPSTTRYLSSTRLESALARPVSVWRSLNRARGRWQQAFGVRGPYFDLRLLAEEVFEIGGQTVAGFTSSENISNVPINITYAAVIFLNGIGAFVFRRIFKHSLVKQRLASLVLDLALDCVWGTLLPIWMYQPIVKMYNNRANILDLADSVSNTTREIERVMVLSWPNYALSVIPFCSSLATVLELRSVLQEMSELDKPGTPGPSSSEGTTVVTMRYPVAHRKPGRFVRFAHALVPMYGTGVLLLVLSANGVFRPILRQRDIACINRVYPWFSTKEACLGRHINCTTLGIGGNQSELDPILESLDKSSLSDLFLLDCPQLEIPSTIHEFGHLLTLVIKESTIVTWDDSAFLDNDVFHDLRSVQLFTVSFVNDPIGLTGRGHQPIAKSAEWFHFVDIDGTRLFSLVGDNWRGLANIVCISCELTTIPDAMYHMPLISICMLPNNNLTSIPDDWWPHMKAPLQVLWLDGNVHLTELPDSLWRQAATAGVFIVSDTNLSNVPEWVDDVAGPDFLLTAAGTPLCADNAEVSPRIKKLLSCVNA